MEKAVQSGYSARNGSDIGVYRRNAVCILLFSRLSR